MSSPAPETTAGVPYQLPSELVSGPDVGGGFLLQLTWARPPHESVYTFHLQEGGTDAAADAAASPDRLGFRHPTSSCSIGGPRCWERSFACATDQRSMVRLAYNRFRFALGPLLDQAGGRSVPPIAATMEQLLEVTTRVLDPRGIPWEIGGSAAAWLQGVELVPGDIDMGTTEEGAVALADELQDYLITPLAATPHDGAPARRGAEAFLGTLKEGARVEWSGASPVALDAEPFSEWGGPGVWDRRRRVAWRAFEVPVAPVEFDLVRAASRGRADRVGLLVDHLRRTSYDPALLGRILDGSSLVPTDRSRLREMLP